MEKEKFTQANTILSGIKMLEGKKNALHNAWVGVRNSVNNQATDKDIEKFVRQLLCAEDFSGKPAIDDIVNNICKKYDEEIAKLQKKFDEL